MENSLKKQQFSILLSPNPKSKNKTDQADPNEIVKFLNKSFKNCRQANQLIFNNISQIIMDIQLKQRILNQKFQDISLEDSITIRSSRSKPKIEPHQKLKLTIIAAFITIFTAYTLIYSPNQTTCIIDALQTFTQSTNQQLNSNPSFYNWWSILAQQVIEIQILLMIIFAIFLMKNLKIHLFVMTFYGLRAIFLNISKFPYPPGFVSYAPSIPAFTVPYGVTRDFYYSGHTGVMVFSILLWKDLQYNVLSKISIVFMIVVIIYLITTRVHYTIDIVGGALFSLWINKYIVTRVIYLDTLFTWILFGLFKIYSLFKKWFNK